ncbi:MAG: hypothetical protein KF868_13115 [Acidobacteria bacterium]|nr:hypothetical protein [Acidobacteriota bacterium]MCW5970645.1 hypothetical protein [Blastocatellales bacterium]
MQHEKHPFTHKPLHRLLLIAYSVLLPSALAIAAIDARAQSQRDHLTEGEADLIREVQIIDQRIEVFIHAADRRLLVLANPNAVQKKKDEERWGPLPSGSPLELLVDYRNILSEAMEKLDDAHERKDPLVVKALNKFKEAALRQSAEMKALAPKLKDAREQRALAEAIAEADIASKGSTQ